MVPRAIAPCGTTVATASPLPPLPHRLTTTSSDCYQAPIGALLLMSELACKNCKFWSEIPGGIIFIEGEDQRPAGECRINPPLLKSSLLRMLTASGGWLTGQSLASTNGVAAIKKSPKPKRLLPSKRSKILCRNHRIKLQSQLRRKQRVVLLSPSPNEKQSAVFGSEVSQVRDTRPLVNAPAL